MPDVLRPGVLDGLATCVAGGAEAIGERFAVLGARVAPLAADLADEDAVAAAVAALAPLDVLVVDAATPFAAAGGGIAALRTAVDGGWNAVRAVANAGWIDGEAPGGKALLVAPAPGAGEHAAAVGAALENTARTLSIEWARHGIRVTALLPGDATAPDEVAELAAYLASPAGDYFTGCAFTLGAVRR